MSAMWLVPQYALLGVAEAAHAVGQIEFFYSLLPKSMTRMASALYTVGTAVSSLFVSILVSGVDWLSPTGGKTSWLSSNINRVTWITISATYFFEFSQLLLFSDHLPVI
ncbi:hypothetical protein MTR67_032193 [Solanum verrucosum]|uniref:Uncharacterized protein n=1 Tax=Solanum verrucosum TaxID=315347 RepID=A0AAF0ZHJ2_SOLVR|nr:hypothetical protein MTR67_032193 [Solanum verrucosum]